MIVSNHQLESDHVFIVLMRKTNNRDIAKNVTYVAPDTNKWIPVEREISDSDNASAVYFILEELCIIKAPTN